MSTGLYYPYMSAVAVDPATPATIYGATSFGGLFKSVDGAANWTHVDSLLFYSTRAVAIASGAVHVGTRQGLFRSTNNGTTWTRTNSGISNNAIGSLGFGPGLSSPLYAGTAASSLFRSANGGNTWTNLPYLIGEIGITAVAVSAGTPEVIHMGTAGGGNLQQFRRLSDQSDRHFFPAFHICAGPGSRSQFVVYRVCGVHPWRLQDYRQGDKLESCQFGADEPVLCTRWSSIRAHPQHSMRQQAAVGFSKAQTRVDCGAPSTRAFQAVPICIALAIDPVSPSTLYASEYSNGVFKTTDGGANWAPANTGISAPVVHDLAVDPATPSIVYACQQNNGQMDFGVYKSTNSGSTWTTSNAGLSSSFRFDGCRIRVDPNSSSTLYVGTYGRGVYKSTNGGASWVPTGTALDAGRKVKNQITSQ